MRVLLLAGCIALGVVVVAASHQDQAESGIEAKNERVQGDFVKDREIRSTGGNKKKNKPLRKATPGMFSAMARPPKMLWKRSAKESSRNQGKRKNCLGCYTSLLTRPEPARPAPEIEVRHQREPARLAPVPEVRHQRDTEVHRKPGKKHKHLKEKSKSKRRRNKEHKEREGHDHFQTEDPEFGQNNKRRKHHHRGKKDKENRHHAGMFPIMSGSSPDTKKTHTDIHNTEDMTN